jgi:hypothetical protein
MLVMTLAAAVGVRPAAAQAVAREGDRLAWLAGCWQAASPRRTLQEWWMPPAGGTLQGMSRAIRGDSVMSWEFVRIEPVNGRLSYVAQPSGQRPATFPATFVSDTLAVFADPTHDFPQRIIYHRRPDSLLARIEGRVQGEERFVEFPFARAACPP